jgi:hypothetical protein
MAPAPRSVRDNGTYPGGDHQADAEFVNDVIRRTGVARERSENRVDEKL